MKVTPTKVDGAVIIEPKVFGDHRGFFLETFQADRYRELAGIDLDFVQDNHSRSSKGVLRGLHFQRTKPQGKLVRVVRGEVFDVVVDIRKGSPTFGKWFGIKLSSDNFKQLLVPRGFAHGFSVLTESATVFYKCDNIYNPESERGIKYNDPTLNIDWKIDLEKVIVSTKDKVLPSLKDAEMNFKF